MSEPHTIKVYCACVYISLLPHTVNSKLNSVLQAISKCLQNMCISTVSADWKDCIASKLPLTANFQ